MMETDETLAPPEHFTAEQRETFEGLKPKQQRAVVKAIETIESAEAEAREIQALADAMERRRNEVGRQVSAWEQELHQRIPDTRQALLEGEASIDDLVDLLSQRRILRDLEAELPELDKAVEAQRHRQMQPGNRVRSANRILGANGLA
ncbi:hypothetical protein [Arhodomonas sp. SL1]|uniref:hypothetical protein n=1 Tax=Arhodomonas sp. SL1 TaxID=3425691 RepID=UPI003F881644